MAQDLTTARDEALRRFQTEYDRLRTLIRENQQLIDQSQHEVRTLEDGTKLIDLDVSFTDEQIKTGVEDTKANVRSLNLVGGTVPLVGFILGPILLIAGVVTMLRSRGRTS